MPNTTERPEELLRARLDALQKENEMMRQLGSFDGFFRAWFAALKDAGTTHEAAFETLNECYFEFFGEYRFKSYESFRVVVARTYKKDKR